MNKKEVEQSRKNTISVEQSNGDWKDEMINPNKEPKKNTVKVEQRDGSWKIERTANY